MTIPMPFPELQAAMERDLPGYRISLDSPIMAPARLSMLRHQCFGSPVAPLPDPGDCTFMVEPESGHGPHMIADYRGGKISLVHG